MTHIPTNSDDMIDIRDVIARYEALESERDAHADEHDNATQWAEENPETVEEFGQLASFLSELAGNGGDEQWRGDWYPITAIRDTYFTAYAQELCEDIGAIPKDLPSYIVIDWDATANNLQSDYSSVEFDGETYWYR